MYHKLNFNGCEPVVEESARQAYHSSDGLINLCVLRVRIVKPPLLIVNIALAVEALNTKKNYPAFMSQLKYLQGYSETEQKLPCTDLITLCLFVFVV